MANETNSTDKKKAPRITKEQLKDIVEFYDKCKDYDLTIRTFEDKWKKEYNYPKEYRIKKEKLKSWIRLYKEDGEKLNERSLLPIYIFEILRKYSNPNHPITEDQIKAKINSAEIFNPEIENPVKAEKEVIKSGKEGNRKIIPRHIRALIKHFPKLIVQVETPKNKPAMWYYDGSKSAQYEFFSRNNFTVEEINFLADMIDSCKVVTHDTSKAFIEKLLDSLNESDENEVKLFREEREEAKEKHDPKSENDYVQKVYEEIYNAINNRNELTITLASNQADPYFEKNVCVYSFFEENGKPYACIGNKDNKLKKIELTKIKQIDVLGKAFFYKEEIIDDLEERGFRQTTNKKDKSIDAEIFNDALFTNARYISMAMRDRKYLQFSNHQSSLKKYFGTLNEENIIRTVIPLKTIYKDGFYYLIAIEKIDSSDKTIFIRINLMKNLMLGKNFSAKDLEKFNNKEDYIDSDPYILSKTRSIDIQFWIKEDAVQRATDEFGDEAYPMEDANPEDTADGNSGKLVKAFPEEFTKSFTGFEYGDKLIKVQAQATEEDALRWALENADAVELISPSHLRLKVLDIAQAINKRYSKTEFDSVQTIYRNVISGNDFLSYGAGTIHEKTLERIAEENAFDKVKKLKIHNAETPISVSELGKFTNLEELVIFGNGVTDFSWIKKLTSLHKLTLISTSIENGDVLADIPQLDLLFLNRNRSLENYEFLKSMKVGRLFIGRNGKADTSALYDVKYVNNLVIEENLLFDLDVEKLMNDRDEIDEEPHYMKIRRWIEGGSHLDDLPTTYSIYPRLYCNKK